MELDGWSCRDSRSRVTVLSVAGHLWNVHSAESPRGVVVTLKLSAGKDGAGELPGTHERENRETSDMGHVAHLQYYSGVNN